MTMRVGTKGQVVIPKAIREFAGIRPGDEVEFQLRGGDVVLVRGARETRPLAGRFAGRGMLQAHEADRAGERERGRW